MDSPRWATFDCYGTLVDWRAGIGAELGRLLGGDGEGRLDRYHEVEARLQREHPGARYREVLVESMRRLGAPTERATALADSLPSWEPFPEVPAAIAEALAHGWKLAILSNSDPPQIEASKAKLGVPFEETIVAGQIGSYKPALAHWREFSSRTAADPSRHVHVAASLFHDIAPANELGLPSVWINRLGEKSEAPTRELPDLSRLAQTLDELVPA